LERASKGKEGKQEKYMAKAATMARDEASMGGRLKQFPARTKSFLTDVRNEMRKVTFPGRKEVQATTVVVIITVILFGLYFYVIDQVIGSGVQWILNHAK
jgi:preprotein translocase subunit SecE